MTEVSSFPSLPRKDRAKRLRQSLLDWFQANQRDLPWRRTRDPYAIWISEAMLQQTRVAAVIDYWQRFLRELPTVQDLAQASEQTVLGLWSGLGYYSRARALRLAAQQIVAEHGGAFPNTRKAALLLPGVGPYTAGAVLSIAYDQPEPLVDGNVERVLCRLFGLPGSSGSPKLRKHLWALTAELVPEKEAGQWNQALMELGATVCTTQSPQCGRCPWSANCAAHKQDAMAEYPGVKVKRAPQDLTVESLWTCRQEQGQKELLLVQRPAKGAMGGLWELPTRRSSDSQASKLWDVEWPNRMQWKAQEEVLQLRHAITHHRIQIRVHRAQAKESQGASPLPEPYRWFPYPSLQGMALTGITQKAVAQLATQ